MNILLGYLRSFQLPTDAVTALSKMKAVLNNVILLVCSAPDAHIFHMSDAPSRSNPTLCFILQKAVLCQIALQRIWTGAAVCLPSYLSPPTEGLLTYRKRPGELEGPTPRVLSGIRSVLWPDLDCPVSELIFDTTVRLPEQLIFPTTGGEVEDPTNFLHCFCKFMRTIPRFHPRHQFMGAISKNTWWHALSSCSDSSESAGYWNHPRIAPSVLSLEGWNISVFHMALAKRIGVWIASKMLSRTLRRTRLALPTLYPSKPYTSSSIKPAPSNCNYLLINLQHSSRKTHSHFSCAPCIYYL
ncbi:unnamed protein product [Schistocephalus solidus]|uniref:Mediator of RNA polymerase II transcription subunit 13 n=1 Tax=Schistocephalus solidus TaxID=70667 RepID=A0A183SN84_SCHSO|nr:unnamed protein product [Schistocephalus solidus]